MDTTTIKPEWKPVPADGRIPLAAGRFVALWSQHDGLSLAELPMDMIYGRRFSGMDYYASLEIKGPQNA
jgi:hypothetical protein